MTDIIATVSTYRDILDAFRSRAQALQISRSQIGELIGISWAEKALTIPPIKHLSLANGMLMVQALRLRILLVDDPDAMTAAGENRPHNSRGRPLDHKTQIARIERRTRTKVAKTAARARWDKTPPENRGDSMRKAWRTRRRNQRKRKVGPECGMQQQL